MVVLSSYCMLLPRWSSRHIAHISQLFPLRFTMHHRSIVCSKLLLLSFGSVWSVLWLCGFATLSQGISCKLELCCSMRSIARPRGLTVATQLCWLRLQMLLAACSSMIVSLMHCQQPSYVARQVHHMCLKVSSAALVCNGCRQRYTSQGHDTGLTWVIAW